MRNPTDLFWRHVSLLVCTTRGLLASKLEMMSSMTNTTQFLSGIDPALSGNLDELIFPKVQSDI
jgi:hypothetical protein